MPFFPYREEEDQTGLLVPRKGWLCDVSQAAPVVYKNKKIIDRADFDREYAALEAQAPFLRRYVDFMLKQNAQVRGLLTKAATTPITGWFALNFSPLLRLNKKYDVADFARRQRPVLMSFAEKTSKAPNLVEYHQYYLNAASDLAGYF